MYIVAPLENERFGIQNNAIGEWVAGTYTAQNLAQMICDIQNSEAHKASKPVYNCDQCNDSGYYDDDGPWSGGYEYCSPREIRCECGA